MRLTESLIPGDGNIISVTKTIRAIEQSSGNKKIIRTKLMKDEFGNDIIVQEIINADGTRTIITERIDEFGNKVITKEIINKDGTKTIFTEKIDANGNKTIIEEKVDKKGKKMIVSEFSIKYKENQFIINIRIINFQKKISFS